ncbi:MAG: DUF1704 domain-containing protein [Candidatus Gracilibacteria bacterium]|nr:DUF1704 domain-containing protein [Candidatus Gracilibacteria bacterium]
MNKDIFQNLLKIDRDLINADTKLSILKHFTPINIEEEKKKFIDSKGTYIPKFKYKKLNINLNEVYEKVSAIKIPRSDLSGIYKRKKEEILNEIMLLKAFEKQDIKGLNKYCKHLYGKVNAKNLEYSNNILSQKKDIYRETDFLSFNDLENIVEEYNKKYDINLKLKEANIVSRFTIIFNDVLLVKYGCLVGKKEIKSVIAHEIEGHHLRRENAKNHKLKIFYYGTAGYVDTEEGIATYNQNKFIDTKDEKYYFNAERYYFINFMLNNTYSKTLKELKKYYNDDYSKIFDNILRLKRGLKDISQNYCYTKDLIYINGYLELLDFIDNGGDIKELYFGKIGVKDLEEIKNSKLVKIDLSKLKIPLFY